MESLICSFIRTNPNWYDILSSSPYNLKIKKDGKYILFMYNQIESDFYIPLVKEARGIIIDINRLIPVCWAFNKFGNYGEGYVDNIDWSTARVQEKIDGSIIKVWYDESWHISSNGMIDAHNAVLDQSNISLGALVDEIGIDYDSLDKNYTHIFELVTPYNRVVIDYSESRLYYLGRRNMSTYNEERVENPEIKEYPLNTLQDCLVAAQALAGQGLDKIEHEGFVVVDADWHRIKIKNPAYVAAHHIRSKQPTFEDMYEIYKKNEIGEFLSTFPNYKPVFDFIDNSVNEIKTELVKAKAISNIYSERKDIAYWYKRNFKYNTICFMALDRNIWNFEKLDEDRIIKILKNNYKRGV